MIEYEENPQRVMANLAYVEKRYKKGEIEKIGPYTVKAIEENYNDQLSLFEVEKQAEEAKKEALAAEKRQRGHRG